jgi:hypothetical protein
MSGVLLLLRVFLLATQLPCCLFWQFRLILIRSFDICSHFAYDRNWKERIIGVIGHSLIAFCRPVAVCRNIHRYLSSYSSIALKSVICHWWWLVNWYLVMSSLSMSCVWLIAAMLPTNDIILLAHWPVATDLILMIHDYDMKWRHRFCNLSTFWINSNRKCSPCAVVHAHSCIEYCEILSCVVKVLVLSKFLRIDNSYLLFGSRLAFSHSDLRMKFCS